MARSNSGDWRSARRRRLHVERLEDRSLLAAVITVNSPLDTDLRDATLTLREALEISNRTLPLAQLNPEERVLISGVPSDTDADTIVFNIQGSGVQTLAITAPLPPLTDPVTIDGYTQPGAIANSNAIDDANPAKRGFNGSVMIQLVAFSSVPDGLSVAAPGSTIRGLAIVGFAGNGISIGGDGTVVEGNFIGVDASGAQSRPNGGSGIVVTSANNRIGGTAAAARNVISGNVFWGVELTSDKAANNFVQGNFIGTDASGAKALGNGQAGIELQGASNNTIGGTPGGARNVVSANGILVSANGIDLLSASNFNTVQGNYVGLDVMGAKGLGNTQVGIGIVGSNNNLIGGTAVGAGNVVSDSKTSSGISLSSSSSNTIQGNLIGTDASGTAAIGNFLDGVDLFDSDSGNFIGGIAAGSGNTIAFNKANGVHVRAGAAISLANSILGNSIFANGGLGIELDPAGATANDPGDADNGPNGLQNFPAMTTALLSGAILTVAYSVPSATTNSAYPLRIEFFKADANAPQGRTFVGFDVYTANEANTLKTVTLSPLPGAGLVIGDRLVGTATDSKSNTSEFSAPVAVAIPLQAHTPSVTDAATTPNTQTTSGLVISRNPADGPEVTHFQMTGITGGTLFQNDGVTPIKEGEFITFAQGNAGLKFTPSANFVGTASFNVQASLSNSPAGLGGGLATARIAVTAASGTFDFGDAPNSYRTLLANDGARHRLGSGLFLGKTVTAEGDGKPSKTAASDAGDEGVTLPARLIAGLDATATVVASAAGRLDAWIDFNRNGVFEANEQIAKSLQVAAGANTVKFAVPLGAASGPAYARFRLSSTGGLAPTGEARDGEVEDYAMPIVKPAAGTAVLIDDPAAPGKKVLVVTGTSRTDHIQIQLKGNVMLCRNGCNMAVYTASSVGRIVVLGLDPSDTVQVDPRIKVPLQIVRRPRR